MPSRAGFTLIELLVVIAIIAVLAVVVVLVLNPAGLLQEARDSNRLSDMATLTSAIGLSLADNASESLGSPNVLYASVPDPSATSTLGDQCQGLGLPALPASFSWHCAASSTFRKTDGTGWVPISLTTNTFGSSLSQLPMDPVNTTSSRLFYSYATDGNGKYEAATPFESQKFRLGGSGDQISGDGGTLASLYERGSKLGLMPLDYGDPSLVGYWTFDEGQGAVAYDYSGSNASGSWNGTLGNQWAAGRVGGGAGNFNGTNNYVSVPDSLALELANTLTISFWEKSTISTTTYFGMVTKYSTPGFSYGYDLGSYSQHQVAFNIRSGASGFSSSAWSPNTSDDGSWHHIVGVFDGLRVITFQDGLPGAAVPWNFPSASSSIPLQIGARGGGSNFFGLIDDVRIYNRALSVAEIQALYSGAK